MKLATLRNGSPDGRLMVVTRELSVMAPAPDYQTMQAALDDWDTARAVLEQASVQLEDGTIANAQPFDPLLLMAPLPRAWQWLDGSAYSSHAELMQRAFDLPHIETDLPLMYQGMSHQFLAPMEPATFPCEADGIDFEAELGIVTGAVPMGMDADAALGHICLAILVNDWSLRTLAPIEMKTGFGWVQAKPACSVAPVAVTLDELCTAWSDGRMAVSMNVELNGSEFGTVPAGGMAFGFGDLIAHAARTRALCAGTIIGSGTVSSTNYRVAGSCCIAERRAIEMIEQGAPVTEFLRFGDRVRLWVMINGMNLFGNIDQVVTGGRYRSSA